MLDQQVEQISKDQEKVQSKRSERQAKMSSLYEALSASYSMDDAQELSLDLDSASLSDIKDSENALNGNMVRLITALDTTTAQLGDEFTTMRELTLKERFFSIFSKSKAAEMRSSRIAKASIDENLQDLLVQSSAIITLLQTQLNELEEEFLVGQKNLADTMELRKVATAELDAIRQKIGSLSPQIEELMLQRDNEPSAMVRTELEVKINELVQQENELKDIEAVELNRSMTLERYIELNKSNVDSLNNQITAQKVMIGKLKTDTAQREILYQSLEVSLRTAEQQETAHAINRIGTETDKVVQKMHASIGSATSNALADMMEQHKGDMREAQEVLRKKADADEIFFRRFGDIMQEHDSGNYDN